MKKIVALVLALVLALSLCTVAFAADTYTLKDDGEFAMVKISAVATNSEGAGTLAGYMVGTTCYVECAADAAGALPVYTNVKGHIRENDVPAFYVVEVDALVYLKTGEAVEASSWSCTTDEHAKGYKGNDDAYYVDAGATDLVTIPMLVDGKVIDVVSDTSYIKGSHLLYLAKSDAVANGVYQYKCAFCGKTVNAAMSKAYAGTDYVEYTADATMLKLLATDTRIGLTGQMKLAAYWQDVIADLGLELSDVDLGTLYLVGEAAAAAADTGVTSAKTFDAGVALYAGMALMSVAGSAVVIGKKKEF